MEFNFLIRILAFILLLSSILFMPIWVSVILALAGMVYFSFFVEATFLFFLSDMLYGVKEVKFFDIIFISSIISILLLVLIEFLKTRTRLL